MRSQKGGYMKTTASVDALKAIAALKGGKFTREDMLDIEKPIAMTVVNKQREKVPVDTSATKTSITPDIQRATAEEVIDHIGPQTTYAPYIELGVASKPNYPIQPFVRPSVYGNEGNIENVAKAAFLAKKREKYG